jgi:hypothetical protein
MGDAGAPLRGAAWNDSPSLRRQHRDEHDGADRRNESSEEDGRQGIAVSDEFQAWREPFRSAKSTVTCLRSPSSAAFEVRIFSARCFGV